LVYDCGEFEKVLDQALELADWTGFRSGVLKREARATPRHRLGAPCQRAGNQSERMEIRVAPNGSMPCMSDAFPRQSHETAFAQMISEWLGVELDKVTLFQGDTDKVLFGRGTFSQRSMSTGGSALLQLRTSSLRKANGLAGLMLEARRRISISRAASSASEEPTVR
jgi:carbon-monoxide dehydrogenase large subunit